MRRELQTHVARRETDAARGGTHGDVHDVQHGERDAARIGDGREREPEHAHEVKRECHPQDRLVGQAIGQPAPDVENDGIGYLARHPERRHGTERELHLLQQKHSEKRRSHVG